MRCALGAVAGKVESEMDQLVVLINRLRWAGNDVADPQATDEDREEYRKCYNAYIAQLDKCGLANEILVAAATAHHPDKKE